MQKHLLYYAYKTNHTSKKLRDLACLLSAFIPQIIEMLPPTTLPLVNSNFILFTF